MSTSPRIFVVGAGYVGGHTVLRMIEQHPEWHLVLLLRNEEQKKIMLAKWPQVEVVLGDLDDKALLMSEAKKADVVLREQSTCTCC